MFDKFLGMGGIAPGPSDGTFLMFDTRGTSKLVDSNGESIEWGQPMRLPQHRSTGNESTERFVDVSGQTVYKYGGKG